MTTIPLRAVPKPRQTRADKWKKRPIVLRFRAYCDELRLYARKHRIDGCLRVEYHFKVPNTWSKKKKEMMMDMPHRVKPDLDNLNKGVLDALVPKDEMVYRIEATKMWSDEDRIIFHT